MTGGGSARWNAKTRAPNGFRKRTTLDLVAKSSVEKTLKQVLGQVFAGDWNRGRFIKHAYAVTDVGETNAGNAGASESSRK